MNNFADFFTTATGIEAGPYEFQCRLACGERDQADGPNILERGTACESRLINVPTGLGKTAGVVLAWLWNRSNRADETSGGKHGWPRRLVYCLPMRTLVEQTEKEIHGWLRRLAEGAAALGLLESVKAELDWLRQHSPIILMGGEDPDREWDIHPDKAAILIGTQDMLLSRALNRGFGMSRYRWPMQFALLNNDCLWVMDETQLMGVGVETSAQLDGFRSNEVLGVARPSFTWWMSATLDETQLRTVDSRPRPMRLEISPKEREAAGVKRRVAAKKRIAKVPLTIASDKKDDLVSYAVALANWVTDVHQNDTLTLVCLNRVDRAQHLYEALQVIKPDGVRLALVHSRFRPCDRDIQQGILLREAGSRIVVATQAIEAGVDVSARTLVTELAPWSSLVQRFGRCHRYGEFDDEANVYWIDLEAQDDKLALPYTAADLNLARKALAPLRSVSPNELAEADVKDHLPIRPVIRRKDLVELADTTPDLAGYDLDISRYVRDSQDADVQVFWRQIDGDPKTSEPLPGREELVRVSAPAFNKAFKAGKDRRVWEWSHVERKWQPLIAAATPGRVFMVDVSHGCYDDELGWTGEKKKKPSPRPCNRIENLEDHDPQAALGVFLDLASHTGNVRRQLLAILDSLSLPDEQRKALEIAASWHDVGKAHPVFQDAVLSEDDSTIWAKGKMKFPYRRPHFRHELASALAWLQAGEVQSAPIQDLVAFLIAAHHGKVRFSLRAMPGEPEERSGNVRVAGIGGKPKADNANITETQPARPEFFARGIWQGDTIGPVDIPGTGQKLPAIQLDLRLMRLGEGSWLERMISLVDDTANLGPFRLTFLETLLRAADMRASAEEAKNGG